MAAKLLLPGYGGKYTSESFSSTVAGVDTLDCSRCAQILVQIVHDSGTPAGTMQLTQTVDGTHFANLGSAIDVATDGTYLIGDVTSGPYGIIQLSAAISSGAVHVEIVGFPIQEHF